MADKAIIMFCANGNQRVDLEVPLNITAVELIQALNSAYSLGIAQDKLGESYLKCENPIALLRGNKTLGEMGIHNGSKISFEK